jgi:hypothetical protein
MLGLRILVRAMSVTINTIILVALLLIAIGSYLIFATPIIYDENSLDPVKIYYSTSKGNVVNISITIGGQEQSSIASKQKYPISYVKFSIKDPFKESIGEYKMGFENFTREIDFWDDSNGYQTFNKSKAERYERENIPDYLIKAPFIKNGFAPVWSQIWQSQPSMSVTSEPFLKQTSFGVWEGKYFFDTKFSGTHLNGETYLPADVERITFEINIPDHFNIDDTGDINLEKISDGYLITKDLYPAKTFHLVIRDSRKEKIKMVISFLSPTLIGIILGMFIQRWLNIQQ